MRLARVKITLVLVTIVLMLGLPVWADAEDEYLKAALKAAERGDEDEYGGEEDTSESMPMAQPVRRISNEAELEEFLNPPEVTFAGGVLAVFASDKSPELEAFENFAQITHTHGYRYAVSVGAEPILKKYSVNGEEGSWKVFVHPPPRYLSETYKDKPRFRFGGTTLKGENAQQAFKMFLLEHYLPLASRLSPTVGNERIFVERGLPVFVVITKLDETLDPRGAKYILNRVRKVADKFRNRMTFAILDATEAESTHYFHKSYFSKQGKVDTKAERIVGIREGRTYYSMQTPFSTEESEKFVQDFFQKKLTPVSIQEDMLEPAEIDKLEGRDLTEEDMEANMEL